MREWKKFFKKNNEGITLISVLIMVIVMIIIAFIAIRGRSSIINQSKEGKAEENLATVKAAVDRIGMKHATAGIFSPANYDIYGKPISSLLKYEGYDLEDWYILEEEDLKELGVENINGTYVVNYKANEVYTLDGFDQYLLENGETLIANNIANKYTVKFNKDDESLVSGMMQPQTFVIGIAQNLRSNAYTKEGYHFVEWNTSSDRTGTPYSDRQKVMNLTEENGGIVNLYPIWEKNTYKITFNANGGTVAPTSKSVQHGEAIGELPTPTRPAHQFDGWYTLRLNGTKVTESTILEENVTYYAHWTASQALTVTFNAHGGNVSPSSKQVMPETEIGTLPIPTREGYKFDGWYTLSSGGTKVTAETKIGDTDVTYYAHWIEVVAQINDTYYHTLQEAVNAVANNNTQTTIKILRNTQANVTIYPGQKIVLDIQNHTINGSNDYATITNNGTLTVLNGTITSAHSSAIENNGTLTIVTKDGTANEHVPVLKGRTYGVQNISGTFNFYDGVLEGITEAKEGVITEKEPGYGLKHGTEIDGGSTYHTSYLVRTREVTYCFGDEEFKGLQYLDTDIYLYNENNIRKDFSITADISNFEFVSGQSQDTNTFVSSMDETGAPYPGFVFRYVGGEKSIFEIATNNVKMTEKVTSLGTSVNQINLRRDADIFYQGDSLIFDYSKISKRFNVPVWLGAGPDPKMAPRRFIKAKLSNIIIKVEYEESEVANLSNILVTPSKEGCVFGGWYTQKTGGQKITSSSTLPSGSIVLYAHWMEGAKAINFNANGGTVNPLTKNVIPGQKIGLLPIPTKGNQSFVGWFTASSGGTQITEDTIMGDSNITYYAHWDDAVAQVYGTNYHTLQEAINQVPTDSATQSTITLLDNISESVTISAGQNILLDLHNFTIENASSNPTITNNGTLVINNGGIIATNADAISNKGTLTMGIKDGRSIVAKPIVQGSEYGIHNSNGGIINFYDGTVKGITDAIKGGEGIVNDTEDNYRAIPGTETISSQKYETVFLSQAKIVTFDANDGTSTTSKKYINAGAKIGVLPEITQEGKCLNGWFTSATGGTQITKDTIIEADVTYYAQWDDPEAEVNGKNYKTLADAISAAPNNTETEVKLLKDTQVTMTIASSKNIILNLQDYTLSNKDGSKSVITNNGTIKFTSGTITSGATAGTITNNSSGKITMTGGTLTMTNTKPVIENSGILEIYGGKITTAGKEGAVNNKSTGNMKMTGGIIESTGTRQAIYNDGGTLEISGTASLSSTTTERATVQNLNSGTLTIKGGTIHCMSSKAGKDTDIGSCAGVYNQAGTLTITGGTIISDFGHGVWNTTANMVIGTQNGNVDTTSPVIMGAKNGIYTGTNTFSFYDGILEGVNAAVDDSTKITGKEDGCELETGTKTETNGKTYQTVKLVASNPITNLSFTPSLTIAKGQEVATTLTHDGDRQSIAYSSENDNIATVTAQGHIIASSSNTGSVTITVTLTDYAGTITTATCSVTVTDGVARRNQVDNTSEQLLTQRMNQQTEMLWENQWKYVSLAIKKVTHFMIHQKRFDILAS